MAYVAIPAAIWKLAVRFIVALRIFYVIACLKNGLLDGFDIGLGIVDRCCKDLFCLIPRGLRDALNGVGGLYDPLFARTAVAAHLERYLLIGCQGDVRHNNQTE